VPSLKSVAESPAFLDPTQSPANSKVFLDVIPTIKLVPVLSTWPKIESTANEELEQALYNLKSMDDAIDMMTKETTELFAQGNSEK
jgi:multiple sugar transport system substrate-binding protein